MIALFIGIFIGFILALFLMGASQRNYDSDIYMQGYEAGRKEEKEGTKSDNSTNVKARVHRPGIGERL